MFGFDGPHVAGYILVGNPVGGQVAFGIGRQPVAFFHVFVPVAVASVKYQQVVGFFNDGAQAGELGEDLFFARVFEQLHILGLKMISRGERFLQLQGILHRVVQFGDAGISVVFHGNEQSVIIAKILDGHGACFGCNSSRTGLGLSVG